MDGLEAMRGPRQQLLCIHRCHSQFTLYRFRDGSFAIHIDGYIVGLWEPDRQHDAIETLAHLLDLPGGVRAVHLRPPDPQSCDPSHN